MCRLHAVPGDVVPAAAGGDGANQDIHRCGPPAHRSGDDIRAFRRCRARARRRWGRWAFGGTPPIHISTMQPEKTTHRRYPLTLPLFQVSKETTIFQK